MTRRGVLILTLIAVALTAFSLALSRRDSRDWRANRARRLFPFPWQDITSVTVKKPDGRVLRFEKNIAGEWRIRLSDDLADTLNNQVVDELSALATLTWRDPLRDAKPPRPEQSMILLATGSSGQHLELAFGDACNNLRSVIVDGDDGIVFGVNQDLLKFLDWPEERFRKLTLTNAATGIRPNRVVLSPKNGDESLRIEMRHTPDGWRMTKPVAWQVDETRLDILMRWIERLRADSIENEYSGEHERFGFTSESAFVEAYYGSLEEGGILLRRVEFGGDAGDGKIYVRETSRNPIFAISREAIQEVFFEVADTNLDLWRNFYRLRAINAVGTELPLEIAVERLLPEPVRLTIAQVRERDTIKWHGVLEEDGTKHSFTVDPPEANEPLRPMTALLAGLSGIRIQAFLTDSPPGHDTLKWTAFPAWRFTSKGPDGTDRPELLLYAGDAEGHLPPGEPFGKGVAGAQEMPSREGAPERAGIPFSIADRPAIMEMRSDLAYLLCRPPYRYQSLRLNDYDPRRWTKLDIVSDDGLVVYTRQAGEVNEQWWVGEDASEPLMDDNNLFVRLLLELSQLRADAFVAGANAFGKEFGLDQPKITAIVYVSIKEEGGATKSEERLFSLAVGDVADESTGHRYARLDNEGSVFLIPGRLAEALARTYR